MYPHTVPQVPHIDYGGALVKGCVIAAWTFATMPGFWIAVVIVVLVRVLRSFTRPRPNTVAVRNRSSSRRG